MRANRNITPAATRKVLAQTAAADPSRYPDCFPKQPGYDNAGGSGDKQCRDLGNKPITNSQQSIALQSISQPHTVLDYSDDQASENIDDYDDNPAMASPLQTCWLHPWLQKSASLAISAAAWLHHR